MWGLNGNFGEICPCFEMKDPTRLFSRVVKQFLNARDHARQECNHLVFMHTNGSVRGCFVHQSESTDLVRQVLKGQS